MGGIAHQPKAGATLTGTEYEAADHHVVTLTASDVGAEEAGAVATHAAVTSNVHGIADTTLVRGTYVQADDPGAVGAGFFWLDTSGNLRVRNSADDGWIMIISAD